MTVPLSAELTQAGYSAHRPSGFKKNPAYVWVEHTSGARGISVADTLEDATANALKLCRAHQRMKARGLTQPNAGAEPAPIRDVDLTTPDGVQKLMRMFAGEIETR